MTSSLTLRQTSVTSSKPAKQSPDSYAKSTLTITNTDAHQTICNGDAACILERIPSVAQAHTDAVKNQYILRREISLMTAAELSNLIKASSKHEESLMMTLNISSLKSLHARHLPVSQSLTTLPKVTFFYIRQSRSENWLDRFLNLVFHQIARRKLCVITWAFWKICSLATLVAIFSF